MSGNPVVSFCSNLGSRAPWCFWALPVTACGICYKGICFVTYADLSVLKEAFKSLWKMEFNYQFILVRSIIETCSVFFLIVHIS